MIDELYIYIKFMKILFSNLINYNKLSNDTNFIITSILNISCSYSTDVQLIFISQIYYLLHNMCLQLHPVTIRYIIYIYTIYIIY